MDNSQVAGTDKNVNTSRPSIYLGQPYHQSQSIFFRLPLEIRLMVYRELVRDCEALHHVRPGHDNTFTALPCLAGDINSSNQYHNSDVCAQLADGGEEQQAGTSKSLGLPRCFYACRSMLIETEGLGYASLSFGAEESVLKFLDRAPYSVLCSLNTIRLTLPRHSYACWCKYKSANANFKHLVASLVDLPKKVRLLMWSDATTCWALDEKDAAALKPFLTTGLEQFQFDIRTRKLSDSGVPIYYWETLERQTEVEVSNHDDRHGAFKNWKVVDKGEITMQHYWRGS
ncbi:hypothetical protein BKA67DRAFT_659496 [Truncatella angustata]|uniref:DUF7730 domain-containing protein n=1 Tax=Truncatella angustata TaxID=152316 RepID=A0A9P8UIG6_9PEZI|nr:uncharacterized protein BKA67DRAFT_659496 [Truncatella angustata]KAH6652825.1 hypothetical protein BKA67DRAFT_659496 [Truncatella angustata]